MTRIKVYMPKDSLESTVGKLDELQDSYADAVKKDQEFKSLFKYKSVAAMLLKYAVPDFEKYSLQEIADSILDIRPRNPKSDAERLHSEIDLLNEESGDSGEKLIRMDKVFAMQFEVKLPDSEQIEYINVTVDFEMQGAKSQDYKLVTRGIYYASSMLRDTLKHADKYKNIHKVYSIWLCNFELLDESGQSGRYVHSYNVFRNYRENGQYVYEKDTDADLIEVIFIELKKLSEHMQDDLAQFLDTVFNDIGGLSKLMEGKIGVAIGGTILEKGVSEVIDMSKYGEIKEAQGERKKAVETAINLIKLGLLTIKQIAQSTGLSEEDVLEAKKTIKE